MRFTENSVEFYKELSEIYQELSEIFQNITLFQRKLLMIRFFECYANRRCQTLYPVAYTHLYLSLVRGKSAHYRAVKIF